MFSRFYRCRKRTSEASIAVVLGPLLLYVISYGPILAYCVRSEVGWNKINVVMTVYRPLALVLPKPVMRQYSEQCGLSDIEAFFFVELMRSGGRLPDDLGIDCDPPLGGRQHDLPQSPFGIAFLLAWRGLA